MTLLLNQQIPGIGINPSTNFNFGPSSTSGVNFPTIPNPQTNIANTLGQFNLQTPTVNANSFGSNFNSGNNLGTNLSNQDFNGLINNNIPPSVDITKLGADKNGSFFNPNSDQFNISTLADTLQVGTGVAQAILGFKQFAEAKRQAAVNQKLAFANFAANRNITNAALSNADISAQNVGFNDGLTHQQFLDKFSVKPLKQTP